MKKKLLPAIVAGLLFSASTSQAGVEDCCEFLSTSFGGLQLQPNDVLLATSIGHGVQTSAKSVLGLDDLSFKIVDARYSSLSWGNVDADGLTVYPWIFTDETGEYSEVVPHHILGHEIAHDIFARHVFPTSRMDQYGTDAPDWLDEAVAVAFEDEEQLVDRRCLAVRLAKNDRLIPIERFLTMRHPELRLDHDRSTELTGASLFAAETPAFYVMSLMVPEYLAAKTGSEDVLREIIALAKDSGDEIDFILRNLQPASEPYRSGIDEALKEWAITQVGDRC